MRPNKENPGSGRKPQCGMLLESLRKSLHNIPLNPFISCLRGLEVQLPESLSGTRKFRTNRKSRMRRGNFHQV
jgi:hypothetical protein